MYKPYHNNDNVYIDNYKKIVKEFKAINVDVVSFMFKKTDIITILKSDNVYYKFTISDYKKIKGSKMQNVVSSFKLSSKVLNDFYDLKNDLDVDSFVMKIENGLIYFDYKKKSKSYVLKPNPTEFSVGISDYKDLDMHTFKSLYEHHLKYNEYIKEKYRKKLTIDQAEMAINIIDKSNLYIENKFYESIDLLTVLSSDYENMISSITNFGYYMYYKIKMSTFKESLLIAKNNIHKMNNSLVHSKESLQLYTENLNDINNLVNLISSYNEDQVIFLVYKHSTCDYVLVK